MEIQNSGFQVWDQLVPILILYVGPESILPLTSALVAIAGVLMMFWQRLVALVQKLWRLVARTGT